MRTASVPDWVEAVPTPCYVIDTDLLQDNLDTLDRVQRETGARILLALKGFAAYHTFPQIARTLKGVAASSYNEARLGRSEFKQEVHTYMPAYRSEDFDAIARLSDHLVFNSISQWERFRERTGDYPGTAWGLRINPEYSEIKVDLYNPCRPGSRFGIRSADLQKADIEGISGLHFHTLCEQNSDVLERTLDVVKEKFCEQLNAMSWINMGGGHHIPRPGYDVDRLCSTLKAFQSDFPHLRIYLEPGEAVALHTGFLVTQVLDLTRNELDIALLDTSATAHMPDVLEMPYRPDILGAGMPGEHAFTCRLGGLTCLAGDLIGDYSFREPLAVGDRLVFTDMAHYTMVKNTTFNGVPLPGIALYSKAEGLRVVREFGYDDYRSRL